MIHVPDFDNLLFQELNFLLDSESPDIPTSVYDTLVFWRTCGIANRVNSGSEAMFLLLNSQRIYDDITLSLSQPNANHKDELNLGMSIVVRKWENIDPVMEFRAFVNNGKMCAMTQYSPYYFIPQFANETFKDQIEQQIMEYFEKQLKQTLMNWESYTIDFAFQEIGRNCLLLKLIILHLNQGLRYFDGVQIKIGK